MLDRVVSACSGRRRRRPLACATVAPSWSRRLQLRRGRLSSFIEERNRQDPGPLDLGMSRTLAFWHVQPTLGIPWNAEHPKGREDVSELRLQLDNGRPALASRFLAAGQALLDSLDDLADEPVNWTISHLSVSSANLGVAAGPDGDDPMNRLGRGLRLISRGERPEWNPSAFPEVRRLVPIGSQGDGELILKHNGQVLERIRLTGGLAEQIAELQPLARVIPGAVRGELRGVNANRGNRGSLRMQSGRTVHVSFPEALVEELVGALLRFVEITDEVKQDESYLPFHVVAESVRLIPDPSVGWSELFGLDPGLTDGLSTPEYLRRMRDDE